MIRLVSLLICLIGCGTGGADGGGAGSGSCWAKASRGKAHLADAQRAEPEPEAEPSQLIESLFAMLLDVDKDVATAQAHGWQPSRERTGDAYVSY